MPDSPRRIVLPRGSARRAGILALVLAEIAAVSADATYGPGRDGVAGVVRAMDASGPGPTTSPGGTSSLEPDGGPAAPDVDEQRLAALRRALSGEPGVTSGLTTAPMPPLPPSDGTSSGDSAGAGPGTASGTGSGPAADAPDAGVPGAAAAGVPARALAAYRAAEAALARSLPGCHLDWQLLAAIGTVESGNGRFGGARAGADGTVSPPILGLRLDGSQPGLAVVGDTDGGRLDGDPVYDRAVGPMQFLPGTWAAFARSAVPGRAPDPQNLDDAALSAGAYLCAGGRDVSTDSGRRAAVFAYNPSSAYVDTVLALARALRAGAVPQLPAIVTRPPSPTPRPDRVPVAPPRPAAPVTRPPVEAARPLASTPSPAPRRAAGAVPSGAVPSGSSPGGAVSSGSLPGGAVSSGSLPGGAVPGVSGARPPAAPAPSAPPPAPATTTISVTATVTVPPPPATASAPVPTSAPEVTPPPVTTPSRATTEAPVTRAAPVTTAAPAAPPVTTAPRTRPTVQAEPSTAVAPEPTRSSTTSRPPAPVTTSSASVAISSTAAPTSSAPTSSAPTSSAPTSSAPTSSGAASSGAASSGAASSGAASSGAASSTTSAPAVSAGAAEGTASIVLVVGPGADSVTARWTAEHPAVVVLECRAADGVWGQCPGSRWVRTRPGVAGHATWGVRPGAYRAVLVDTRPGEGQHPLVSGVVVVPAAGPGVP